MYATALSLSGLGVISDTASLIAYLINGFIGGLKARVADDVNLYSAGSLQQIVRDGVIACVTAAAASSSQLIITRELMSQIMIRFRDQFPGGDPSLFAFGNSAQRAEGIRHLNRITEAVRDLCDELLARWVPPTSADPTQGATVTVNTEASRIVVDEKAAAAGPVPSGASFLEKYGLYIAGGLLLLLFINRGK